MENQLEKTQPQNLISQAIEKGADIAQLKELMDLQERWEAKQAKKAFYEAISQFQSVVPEIRKSKGASFGAGKTSYAYAPLSSIVRQIKDGLKKSGLSFRWENKETGDDMQVTCIITHLQGHSESTSMTGKADASGSKNPIQARGSAISYLQRYTLLGALGIASADTDVDGQQAEVDLDALHKDYMKIYDQVIQLDPTLTKYDPDNWKKERTGKTYTAAIKELANLLVTLTPKK